MSLASAPYWWLVCDRCGVKSTEGGDFSAWEDIDGARSEADCSDWIEIDAKDYCPNCWIIDENDDHVVRPTSSVPE